MIRRLVLAAYCYLGLLQGASWSVFANLPDAAKRLFPGLSDVELALALAFTATLQGITVPAATWLLSRPNGFRLTCVAASLCTLVQSGSWLFASLMPHSFRSEPGVRFIIYFGASFGGVGCCFVEGSPSFVSALWFPLNERGRATAIAYIATFLGQCLGFLVSMSIGDGEEQELVRLECWQTGLIATTTVALIAWFPNDSRSLHADDGATEPLLSAAGAGAATDELAGECDGDEQQEQRAQQHEPMAQNATASGGQEPSLGLLQGLGACAASPSCMLLIVACAVINGAYVAWQSLMPILFGKMPGFISHDGDLFGFSSGVCYCVGGYLSGELADRYFAGQLKSMLVFVYAASVANFALLLVLMPSPLKPLLPGSAAIDTSYSAVAVAVTMTGLFTGATMPPSLELLAEVAFPVSEGTTANVTQLLVMVSHVAITAALPLLPSDVCNSVMGGVALLCALCMVLVKNSNARREAKARAEESDLKHETAGLCGANLADDADAGSDSQET